MKDESDKKYYVIRKAYKGRQKRIRQRERQKDRKKKDRKKGL